MNNDNLKAGGAKKKVSYVPALFFLLILVAILWALIGYITPKQKPAPPPLAKQPSLKAEYLKYLELRNIQSDGRVISGDIKNTGEKSLKTLILIIYYFDRNDKLVYEKQYRLVDSSSILDTEGPLRPNYARVFKYRLERDLPDWSGATSIKITNFEFE